MKFYFDNSGSAAFGVVILVKRWAFLLVIIAAIFWGIIGLFVQGLYDYGFTPLEVVTIRVVYAAIILVSYTAIKNRSQLIIRFADWKYFIGTGIFSIVFFNWCLFTAIQETSLSIAVILLYTGPAFVSILSRIFFKELLTKPKTFSLLLAFVGCCFVIGVFPTFNQSISFYGGLVGLGAGFGYALYSIFGKIALNKMGPLTVATYTFVFASAAMFPTSGIWRHGSELVNPNVLFLGIGLGLFPTALAFILYTSALKHIESSKASITTTIEPVVATMVGVFIFGDILSQWQITGVIFVLASVIIVQMNIKRPQTKN
jgi:drug/metabolite transporter (DMT)-like permease